jgi:hypothetical protein
MTRSQSAYPVINPIAMTIGIGTFLVYASIRDSMPHSRGSPAVPAPQCAVTVSTYAEGRVPTGRATYDSSIRNSKGLQPAMLRFAARRVRSGCNRLETQVVVVRCGGAIVAFCYDEGDDAARNGERNRQHYPVFGNHVLGSPRARLHT